MLPLFFIATAAAASVDMTARFDKKIRSAYNWADYNRRGRIAVDEAYALLRDHTGIRAPSRRAFEKIIDNPRNGATLLDWAVATYTLARRSIFRPLMVIGGVLVADAFAGRVSDRTWLNLDLIVGDWVSVIGRVFLFGASIPVIDSELMSQIILTALFLVSLGMLLYDGFTMAMWILPDEDGMLAGDGRDLRIVGNDMVTAGKELGKDMVTAGKDLVSRTTEQLFNVEAPVIFGSPKEEVVEEGMGAGGSAAIAIGGAAAALGLGLASMDTGTKKKMKKKMKKVRVKQTPGLVLPLPSNLGSGRSSGSGSPFGSNPLSNALGSNTVGSSTPADMNQVPAKIGKMGRGEKALMSSLVAGGATFLLSVV